MLYDFEYHMSDEMAKGYLEKKNKREEWRKMTNQEYLQYVVNQDFCLLGNCNKVTTSL